MNEQPVGPEFGIIMFLVYLALYAYVAYSLQTIARKTGTEKGWLAWIPIANLVLMLNIAQKPIWWIILFLIPIANIVIFVLVWMGISGARGKASWLGILILIPIANLILPGYLAFSD